MAKKSKQVAIINVAAPFIYSLKQRAELLPYLEQIQKFAPQVAKKLAIEDTINDIFLNLEMLQSRTFLGLQTQRLAAVAVNATNIAQLYPQFQEILEADVLISTSSRIQLDPHCKSEQDYSSAISHYKKWLFNLLFLILIFHPLEDFKYSSEFLEAYLLFAYAIDQGETISKVKIRTAPKIDAESLMDLPRNTALRAHRHLQSEHWIYVSIPDLQLSGYVPLAYIKLVKI